MPKTPIPAATLEALRRRIQAIEGLTRAADGILHLGPAAIDQALPWGGLPLACLHHVVGCDDTLGPMGLAPSAAVFVAALAARLKNRGTVVWCPPLRQLGRVDPGLSLPDARAVCPILKVVEADRAADQACLNHFVVWCRRYTPWVAAETVNNTDGSAGMWLDVTGCTHLFGGEQATLDGLSVRFGKLGFTTRLGLADTPGAAWAAAHHLAQAKTPALNGKRTGCFRRQRTGRPVASQPPFRSRPSQAVSGADQGG